MRKDKLKALITETIREERINHTLDVAIALVEETIGEISALDSIKHNLSVQAIIDGNTDTYAIFVKYEPIESTYKVLELTLADMHKVFTKTDYIKDTIERKFDDRIVELILNNIYVDDYTVFMEG